MAESGGAATAAIQFAVKTDDGIEFLRCWQEGDFAAIRRDWPDAPPGVFEGVEHPRLSSDAGKDSRATWANQHIDMRALGELLLEAARHPHRGGGMVISAPGVLTIAARALKDLAEPLDETEHDAGYLRETHQDRLDEAQPGLSAYSLETMAKHLEMLRTAVVERDAGKVGQFFNVYVFS
ncbi:hypothetical protein DEE93_16850 [Ralstonia pickettii]|uniref:DUF1877 domain-containing protein n=2 Tax=Ralstonia pickettii TaxID=329 RepID=A0AAW4Q6N1_RALPI|nr:hypothetical protein [Ralstonia pickettii]MBA9851893.1 hypothetical protein [Ralstonia pickettii]MBA9919750.1 hypothetical protein [Ralstonia pickettii]MBA9958846.1 hypothetical protein [Ralstonia pickettii]MBA9965035.1 hypothetical protein [Ralstonia pickettii]